MKNEDSLIDKLLKMDHPMVHKFKKLKQEAFKSPTTDEAEKFNEAEKFLIDWKKNNPEEAEELRKFLWNFGVEE